MTKLLFIDHVFHQKTRSSEFFKEFLRQHFEVEEIHIDPMAPLKDIARACEAQADVVLVWQLDFLVPIFLSAGCKTIAVPMYDGSANMPDLHWMWAHQARFINFSRRLHDRVSRVGGTSMLVKYFPKPQTTHRLPEFDTLRVFLWQRRPNEGINLSLVERLLGPQLSSLHIHDSADDPEIDTAPFMRRSLNSYDFTSSRWFQSSAQYLDLLDRANVFVAPRRSEGIGMAMIEAMSRGMVVLASDWPVHDEYISNWINGVLFNPDAPGEFTLTRSDAERLSDMASRTVAIGHETWRDNLPALVNFIRSTPAPDVASRDSVSQLSEGLCKAYLAGDRAYSTYLFEHLDVLRSIAGDDIVSRVGPTGNYLLDVPRFAGGKDRGQTYPWLSQNRMKADEITSGRFLCAGKIQQGPGVAWVARHSVTFGFRLDPRLGATNNLEIQYCCPPGVLNRSKLCISLNGWTLWNDNLDDAEGKLVVALLPHAKASENTLVLQLNEVAFGQGAEPVSLGIREIAFV
jgi:hypothetical protein